MMTKCMASRRVLIAVLTITGVLLISAGILVFDPSSKKTLQPQSPVTALSVLGSSGQLPLRVLLKKMVGNDYKSDFRDENNVKFHLSAHLAHSKENVELFEKFHIRAVLVYRDPRDTLKHLVDRSLNYLEQFDTPTTNPDAVALHQLIVDSKGTRGDQHFVQFYIETIGAQKLLQGIFQIAEWRQHPYIHAVKFEELTNLRGNDKEAQLRVIQGIADFLQLSLSRSTIKELGELCSQQIRKKQRKAGFMVRWNDVFTEEDNVSFKKNFGQLLIDLGYEKDTDW